MLYFNVYLARHFILHKHSIASKPTYKEHVNTKCYAGSPMQIIRLFKNRTTSIKQIFHLELYCFISNQ